MQLSQCHQRVQRHGPLFVTGINRLTSEVKLAMNHVLHIICLLMGQRYAQHPVKSGGHCQLFLFGKRNTQASSIHMLMNFCDFT